MKNSNGNHNNIERIWKYVEKNEKKWDEHLAEDRKRWAENSQMWWRMLRRMDEKSEKADAKFIKIEEKIARLEEISDAKFMKLEEKSARLEEKSIKSEGITQHILSEFRRHLREH